MAKRFTDTEKYRKKFHRGLPGPYKLLWDYLYHDCNHAGIWHADFEIAQIFLGKDMPVERERALHLFNLDEERIIVLDGGSKWFIPSFIEFQYDCSTEELNPGNGAHRGVIKILQKYGLYNKPLPSPSEGAKGKGKGKKGKNGKKGEKKETDPRIKRIIDYFHDTVLEKKGFKPHIKGGQDSGIVQGALQQLSEEECRAVIDFFIDSKKAADMGITLNIAFSVHTINLYRQKKAESGESRDINMAEVIKEGLRR